MAFEYHRRRHHRRGGGCLVGGLHPRHVAGHQDGTAVAVKDTTGVTVTVQIRTYAQAISNNPGVSSGNKIALGLNPKASTPQPITADRATPSSRRGQQLFPTGGVKQCGDHPREPIGVRDAAQRLFGLRACSAEPPPAK